MSVKSKKNIIFIVLCIFLVILGIKILGSDFIKSNAIFIRDVTKFKPKEFDEESFLIVYEYKEENDDVYYIMEQLNNNGDLLESYKFDSVIINNISIDQNIFNENYIYIIDDSNEGIDSAKINDIKINLNQIAFEEINDRRNIVGVNIVGDSEIFGYIDENNILSLVDKTRGVIYENIIEYSNNQIANLKSYLMVTGIEDFVFLNKNKNQRKVVESVGDLKVNNPKIVTYYNDKVIFLPSSESKNLYSIDENFDIEFFSSISTEDFEYVDIDYIRNKNIILFNFLVETSENEFEDKFYRMDLKTNDSYKVEYDFFNKDFMYNLLYVFEPKSYLYVKESKEAVTDEEFSRAKIAENGVYYVENILVIDYIKEEMLYKFELKADEVNLREDRIIVVY